ncbi:hypothetical protein ACVMAJ_006927 [Bradyrhizobium sp. USDA 4448]
MTPPVGMLSTGKGADAYRQPQEICCTIVSKPPWKISRQKGIRRAEGMSRSLQSINPPPQDVNVNVTCPFGCRYSTEEVACCLV